MALALAVSGARAHAQPLVPHVPVVGTVRTYVYAVDFADARVPCTADDLEPVVAAVADYWEAASFGQLDVAAEVLRNPAAPDGHFAVPYTCEDLAGNAWRFDAEIWEQIAAATGIDLAAASQQGNVKIVKEDPCTRGGSAGQAGVRAQVGRCWDAALLAHEYGHTLGLAHASKNRPQGSRAGEYAPREVMGQAGRRSLALGPTAPARMQLGWMPAGAVRTVTMSTTLVLADLDTTPMDPASDAVRVMRIPKSDELATSPYFRDYYYVALRSGALDVHGVEMAPSDIEGNERLFGNTLQRLRKARETGRHRDKSGRFELEWTFGDSGDALVTLTVH